MEKGCLLTCSSIFLKQPKTTWISVAPSIVDLTLLHHLENQKCHTQISLGQYDFGNSSIVIQSSQVCLGLSQDYKNL